MTIFEDRDRQASDWLVEIESGHATLQQRERFESWLRVDSQNRLAYERTRATWHELGAMQHWKASERVPEPVSTAGFESRARFLAHRMWRPRALAAVFVIGLCVVAGFFATSQPTHRAVEKYATRTAEIREIALPDGSRVVLGARSAIDVHYSATERRIALMQGAAFFKVESEPSRPFVVVARDTLVRALGTQFEVQRHSQKIRVVVQEGTVEVTRASRPDAASARAERYLLAAGEKVETGQGAPQEVVGAVGPETVGAWRSGRLVYENATLGEVIADVQRYSDVPIEFAQPSLAQLRVTASFDTGEVRRLLDTLTLALPVQTEPGERGAVRIRARP